MDGSKENRDLLVEANPEVQKNVRKRRYSVIEPCSPGEENHSVSRGKFDDGASAAKLREVDVVAPFKLDHFCDEILFEIFKHLDSWTLLALMNCCNRFHTLILDRRFWYHTDLSKEALPLGIIEDVLERTHHLTSCIKLHGPAPSQHVDGEIKQFNQILAITFSKRCTQLTVLELQGITIDFNYVRIVDFPKTLKRLILSDCSVRVPDNVKSIFTGIDTHLKDLEELGIEYSDWLEPYYIMIFSKSPALRWLSLRGCQLLSEFVPYGSMAARFGFKQLEYLDLRFTPLTDSDLQCFNAVVTLKEILLDCPEEIRDLADKNEEQIPENNNDDCQASTSSASTPPVESLQDNETPSTSAAKNQLNVTIALSTPGGASQFDEQYIAHRRNDLALSSSSSSSSSSPSYSSSSSAPNSPAVSPPALQILPAINNRIQNNDVPPHRGSNNFHRRDVIFLDLQQQRRPFLPLAMPLRRMNQGNHLDQVISHPLFWDMINPLGRAGRPMARLIPLEAEFGNRNRLQNRQRFFISDRGICCFGRPQNPVEQGIIWIRIGNRPMENRFERISVRNYKFVTDISLQHLVQCSPYLVFIDLSGTSVTREGVQNFKEHKPECQIVADHLVDVPEDEATPEETVDVKNEN